MKSKISFCKKALLKNNIKMYAPVFLLWAVYLFLRYPLVLLQYNKATYTYDTFSLATEPFIFLVPIATGVALYHFLKTDNGTAFYLSLPATKTQLYFSQFLSGLILCLAPLLLNILLSLGIAQNVKKEPMIAEIVYWGIAMVLLAILNYCVSIGIGMITGSIIWHLLFVLIFYLLPLYFSGAASYLGGRLLYGFTGGNPVSHFFNRLDLLARISDLNRMEEITADVLIFIGIYAAVVFVLAFLLYRYKKMENNRDWIGFGFLKIIFIIGFTLCAVVLMSVILTEIVAVDNEALVFYTGAAIGAVLGYVVAAMIAWKTIYLKKAWWGTLAALAITLAVLGLIDADFFGYERKVPAPEEVAGVEVYLSSLGNDEEDREGLLVQAENDYRKYTNTYEFKESANIALAQKIHRLVIEQRGVRKETDNSKVLFHITYRLNNGKTIRRAYTIEPNALKEDWEKLKKSPEGLKQMYPVLREEVMSDVVGLRVSTEASRAEESFRGTEMKELLTILRQELVTAVTSPEKVTFHGQVQILEQIPIRIDLVRERKERWQDNRENGERVESTLGEESIVFYSDVPQLRRWLSNHSNKYREMTDIASLVQKLEIYRLPKEEFDNYFSLEERIERTQPEEIEALTNSAEIMPYLKLAGICESYRSKDTLIVLKVFLKDDISYFRAMTEEDYNAVRAKKR